MTRQSKGTWQKNRNGDRKGEPNDSPEIPDRGVPSNIPGLPSVGFDRLGKKSSYRKKPDEKK